jgi:hypothetical protein
MAPTTIEAERRTLMKQVAPERQNQTRARSQQSHSVVTFRSNRVRSLKDQVSRAGRFLGRCSPQSCLTLRTRFDQIMGAEGARAMSWKQDLDALIESTMAFARDVQRQSIPDLPVAMRTAEQALADTSKPIPPSPMVWPASERDEIRQRVSNFKAHQEKMAREREDYYLQIRARMLAGR